MVGDLEKEIAEFIASLQKAEPSSLSDLNSKSLI